MFNMYAQYLFKRICCLEWLRKDKFLSVLEKINIYQLKNYSNTFIGNNYVSLHA